MPPFQTRRVEKGLSLAYLSSPSPQHEDDAANFPHSQRYSSCSATPSEQRTTTQHSRFCCNSNNKGKTIFALILPTFHPLWPPTHRQQQSQLLPALPSHLPPMRFPLGGGRATGKSPRRSVQVQSPLNLYEA